MLQLPEAKQRGARSASARKTALEPSEEVRMIKQHIAEETAKSPDADVAGFDYFCSKMKPEWFAVQVTSPPSLICNIKRGTKFIMTITAVTRRLIPV